MDQKKIGNFLKELRKENSLTQEQVAEKLGVSSRTISRWETGTYMPDISMLVDIAEMYDVDVREVIDGERNKENMNSEIKEVAVKMADYSMMETNNIKKWLKTMSFSLLIVAILLVVMEVISAVLLIRFTELTDNRFIAVHILQGLIGPESIMAYITMGFSIMGIVFATDKHKQLIHSPKAITMAKIGAVIAIILSIIALTGVVLRTGTYYNLLNSLN